MMSRSEFLSSIVDRSVDINGAPAPTLSEAVVAICHVADATTPAGVTCLVPGKYLLAWRELSEEDRRELWEQACKGELISLFAPTALMGQRLVQSEVSTAADPVATVDVRAACIARVCTRALGVGGVGLDSDLLHAIDVAIRAAVVRYLSQANTEALPAIEQGFRVLAAEGAYYLTSRIKVDPKTETKLIDNGEMGDAKVTLCCATGLGQHAGEALYYLTTNGDPVLLTDDVEATRAFVETLGRDSADVIEAIRASDHGVSSDWAIDQIREASRLEG